MTSNWIAAGASLLILGSCAISRDVQILETKAMAGDAGAACQLVLRDLEACVAARKEWIALPGSARSSRMEEPLPAAHLAYLSHAIERLEATPERKQLLGIIADGAALTATALEMNIGAQD